MDSLLCLILEARWSQFTNRQSDKVLQYFFVYVKKKITITDFKLIMNKKYTEIQNV